VEAFLNWRRSHIWRTKSRTETSPATAVPARGRKASASTIGRDRELLCAAFNRLLRLGELEANPVAKVPKPRKPTRTKPVLSKTEIRRLVESCDKYLRPLVLAGLFTGARKGELLRMVWGDVSFEQKTIAVTRSKTGNASLLPLAPLLAAELQRVKQEREEKRRRPVPDDEPIFLSRYGRVYRCIRGGWMAAMKRAGLDRKKGVTPHILRHCFAVHYLGVPGAAVTDLQEALGHSSLKTTSIYAQMADERMRKTVSGLDFGF
jgi:integrase